MTQKRAGWLIAIFLAVAALLSFLAFGRTTGVDFRTAASLTDIAGFNGLALRSEENALDLTLWKETVDSGASHSYTRDISLLVRGKKFNGEMILTYQNSKLVSGGVGFNLNEGYPPDSGTHLFAAMSRGLHSEYERSLIKETLNSDDPAFEGATNFLRIEDSDGDELRLMEFPGWISLSVNSNDYKRGYAHVLNSNEARTVARARVSNRRHEV